MKLVLKESICFIKVRIRRQILVVRASWKDKRVVDVFLPKKSSLLQMSVKIVLLFSNNRFDNFLRFVAAQTETKQKYNELKFFVWSFYLGD